MQTSAKKSRIEYNLYRWPFCPGMAFIIKSFKMLQPIVSHLVNLTLFYDYDFLFKFLLITSFKGFMEIEMLQSNANLNHTSNKNPEISCSTLFCLGRVLVVSVLR